MINTHATPPRALPPLDLLRGFESAARHLSFTRAAAELFLTQSAVSRQIQALEAFTGVALFERRHKRSPSPTRARRTTAPSRRRSTRSARRRAGFAKRARAASSR
ncbi:MAG TPA: LysR family transcriptional regulator [Usitatibacter sp.]